MSTSRPIDGSGAGPTGADGATATGTTTPDATTLTDADAPTAAEGGGPGTAGAAACATALRALATGDYGGWSGLAADCTTDDAEAALGAGGADQTGFPGGSPTRYRTHPASAGAPFGLQVYDVDGRIVLVTTHDAVPAGKPEALLGPPEAKAPSRMPGFATMWIWASRGLTLHIDDRSGKVTWLYAYAPMTAEAFRASWMAKVEMHRRRVR